MSMSNISPKERAEHISSPPHWWRKIIGYLTAGKILVKLVSPSWVSTMMHVFHLNVTRKKWLAKVEEPLLVLTCWETQCAKECIAATRGVEDKKKAAQTFNLWLSARNSAEMVVSTDGSQRLDKEGKKTGTGTA